ncbi:MAG: sensor histidine kinase [Planctomycetaceae bacterium]
MLPFRPLLHVLAIASIVAALVFDLLTGGSGVALLWYLPAVLLTLWANVPGKRGLWVTAVLGTIAILAAGAVAGWPSPLETVTRLAGVAALWEVTLLALSRIELLGQRDEARRLAERLRAENDALGHRIQASSSELTASIAETTARREEAEQALRESEALYHSLVDHLPLSVLRKDANFRYTFVNRRFLEYAGRTADEVLGKTDFDLFPEELAKKYREGDELVQSTGRLFDDVEVYRKPDGEVRHIQVWKMPVRDALKRIVGTQVAVWDVTDRHRVEEAMERFAYELERRNLDLLRSEESLRRQTGILESVLQSIADGVVVADESGKFLIWNPAAERIIGLGPTRQPAAEWPDVYGLFEIDGVTPYPPDQLPLARAIRGEVVRDVEIFMRNSRRPQGAFLSVNGDSMRNAGGEICGGVVVFRDVTERKQAEAEIRSKNADLETLLYVISHDLREPLRAIENFSRLVGERYAGQLDEKGQDFLQRIVAGAHRMDRLLEDVLTLSRVERTTQPEDGVATDEIVADVLKRLEPRIRETQAQVQVLAPLPALRVDRRWTTQAVQNLVSNALKFVPASQVPEIEIAGYTGPEGVGLAVRDRGMGVPAELAERIFGLFQRGVGRNIEGTGAGLAIVRRVAERHGGRAWVQPRPGGGSEFVITFGPGAAA